MIQTTNFQERKKLSVLRRVGRPATRACARVLPSVARIDQLLEWREGGTQRADDRRVGVVIRLRA